MDSDLEFNPSLTLTGQERQWVLEALSGFYEDHIITDILYRVKGGKEATVFCCRAHPDTGRELLAAKIFRPRMFRAMKNDVMYREGRTLRDRMGKSILESRQFRALQKKTSFGKHLAETAWHQHEFGILQLLCEAGADVPRPFTATDNVILMEYIGDEERAAPTLHEVTLDPEEAREAFSRLMQNIEIFLTRRQIHGDLSAYNVLYWNGDLKIIDFPQAVDATTNTNAFLLLSRDIERICQYFARYGVQADAARMAIDLWTRFLNAEWG